MGPARREWLSVRVQCWRDDATDTTRLRVQRIDGQEEIRLNAGTFLLRVAFERGQLVERCLIRHMATGREAYVQGGRGLSAFVRDCLLVATVDESTAGEREEV